MKKSTTQALALVLLCWFIGFAGATIAEAQQITFGTAAPTGGWMMLASSVSKILNDNVAGVNVTPVPSPRGSVENIETIQNGERELGLTMANIALQAKKGLPPFKQPATGINGWFSAHYGYWYLLAREDSDIKSFQDLKGKRIAIGNPGDGDEALNKEVFEVLGLAWKDFRPEYSGLSGAMDLIKQNQIDAFAYVAQPKLPSLTELLGSKKLRLVAIPEDGLKKVEAALPYVVLKTMPRSDFEKLAMPESATVISINHMAICSAALKEETMYAFTKALFENINAVQETSKTFAVITPENAVKGLPIPIHPGALKFYREKGLLQ
ncbi:MAG: TAXI family TRAP transporter solute-binding subunit [Desulfobacterales bacterium]|jgi:hypothetical protein|nr:TAXI family TRAP transporter solute-binding subunit [Desulfobacterales bacterium]